MNDSDRIVRAGHYVSGLMSDSERERAERDLERDASFREAVVKVSQRMRAIDGAPCLDPDSDDLWAEISARLAELPQLRDVLPLRRTSATPAAAERLPAQSMPKPTVHRRDQIRAGAIAASIAIVFATGYFMGSHPMPLAPIFAQVDLAPR